MDRRPHGPSRRGVTLIEVSVSILLVASLGSLLVGALVSRARQERAIDRRELAVAEAANLMEQLTSLAWNDLTQKRLAPLKLSENLRQSIPAAALEVAVETPPDKPEGKRISIKIDCPGPSGQATRPVRLTSWVYRIGPEVAAGPKEEEPDPEKEAPEAEEKP
ncbi:MAG TPA: prepilin-type N-terminal cleavage/methylation domain-containing protein [Pirellulales bacterium]|jgi:prepilin-type N-terminal cleavage/methylation domain-containing protein|nr:prepilin-type N-terminal cleavage/methylation domain-containing protein [Pirellulales bacterium]